MPFFPILEISTVVGCRMVCGYCPQGVHVKSYGQGDRRMSMATFGACLDNVPTEVQIQFAGMAEPWLNPCATDMVLEASRRGHKVSVYSTLDGMSPSDVDRLAGVPLEHFCVHLPDADGTMKLRVTDQWLATLGAVRSRLRHHFVVYGRLHPAARAALGFDVRDDSPGLLSRAGNLRPVEPKKGALSCTACGPKLDHNILLPNGDVALCCMVYDLRHILGNLSRQSWASLFEGDEYRRVMRGMAGDESVDLACRRCELSSPA